MADKLPSIQPPSKPFPGSLTPGWNDPPTVNNESRPQGRPKLNLNKRVAFPVQGMTSQSSLEDSSKSLVASNAHPMGSLPPPHPLEK